MTLVDMIDTMISVEPISVWVNDNNIKLHLNDEDESSKNLAKHILADYLDYTVTGWRICENEEGFEYVAIFLN